MKKFYNKLLIKLAFGIVLKVAKRIAARTDNDIDDLIVNEIEKVYDEASKLL